MLPKRVVLDIDGVLANLHQVVVNWMNNHYGFPIHTIEDINSWDAVLEYDWGVVPVIYGIEEVLANKTLVETLPLMKGCWGVVNKLSEVGIEIVIATSRRYVPYSWTEKWLKNTGLPYNYLVSTGMDKTFLLGKDDILIEDNPEAIKNLKFWNRILIYQPWNRGSFTKGVAWNYVAAFFNDYFQSTEIRL